MDLNKRMCICNDSLWVRLDYNIKRDNKAQCWRGYYIQRAPQTSFRDVVNPRMVWQW